MAVIKTALSFTLLLSLGLNWGPVHAREKPLSAVADLRYGTALYEYYLDDYMSALTELLVAEQHGGIVGHGDNPEIMEAGLALGYNMERYASEIFERLLEQNRSQEVRDAAWFYLARLRYKNGDWQRSQEALERLSKKPVKSLRQDANALRINLLLKNNDTASAEQALKKLDLSERWLPYFYFNIGSALARERQFARAVEYFNRLAAEEYQREEYRALYDKAMTAAGYSYLFQQRYPEAMAQFARVRLSSALSNRALLGYGWAAAEMGDYQEALRPWLHLANSALIDENNQEAMIAVPYAYEQLGSDGLALSHYQKAEQSFSEEIDRINAVLNSLKSEELLTALEIEQRGELDWMSIAKQNQLSPRLAYLVSLFSRDSFQGSIQELQDLLALKANMELWQEKLAFYETMLDEREANRGAKAEFLQVAELEKRIEEMRAQRKALAFDIERIAADKDYFALASNEDIALIKRITRSQRNVELLRASDPFIDEYEEAVRRYNGLLLWQASESYGDRLWQAIKTLNQLDNSLQDVSDTQARVDKLMQAAPDLGPYRARLASANTSLEDLLAAIDALINRSEGDLKLLVMDLLQEQRSRLSNYLAQSRLSVARLYDKARQHHEDVETQKSIDRAKQRELSEQVETDETFQEAP